MRKRMFFMLVKQGVKMSPLVLGTLFLISFICFLERVSTVSIYHIYLSFVSYCGAAAIKFRKKVSINTIGEPYQNY